MKIFKFKLTLFTLALAFIINNAVFSNNIASSVGNLDQNIESYRGLFGNRPLDKSGIISLFPVNKQEVQKILDEKKQQIRHKIQVIIDMPDYKRTFDNTFRAFDEVVDIILYINHYLEFLNCITSSDGVSSSFQEEADQFNSFRFKLFEQKDSELCDVRNYFLFYKNQEDKFLDFQRMLSFCKGSFFGEKLSQSYDFNRSGASSDWLLLNSQINSCDDLAKESGFGSYSELTIENEMAKTPKNVEMFLHSLLEKVMPKARAEVEELKQNRPSWVDLTEDGKLKFSDIAYLKELYKKRALNFDTSSIKEYFPAEKTINEICRVISDFLNLDLVISDAKKAWYKDVKLVEVFDKETHELLGYILLDLFSRPNKYEASITLPMVPAIIYKDKNGQELRRPAVSVVLTDFSKSSKDGSLLFSHDNVADLFHELGHAIHYLFNSNPSAMDARNFGQQKNFAEIPSQMFEEWAWDKSILQKISFHYKTGRALPEEFIDRMLESRADEGGFFVYYQSLLSFISLEFFASGKDKNLSKIALDLFDKYDIGVCFKSEIANIPGNFKHLIFMDARYYSYMWSKIIALDLFDSIKNVDALLNPKIGKDLIDKVLSKNNTQISSDMISNFLGRDFNKRAFFKSIGIDSI